MGNVTKPLFSDFYEKKSTIDEQKTPTDKGLFDGIDPDELETLEDDDVAEYKDHSHLANPKGLKVTPDWVIKYKFKGEAVKIIEHLGLEPVQAKLLTFTGQVTYILAEFVEARNSDDTLERLVLSVFYGVTERRTLAEYWAIEKCPNRDDIKRIRASLQSKGYFMPTSPEVRKKRNILEEFYRQHYG